MTSEFVVFFSSNPSLNHIKIEKCLLLFAKNTKIFTLLFKELWTDGKSFIFAVYRLTSDHATSSLISLSTCFSHLAALNCLLAVVPFLSCLPHFTPLASRKKKKKKQQQRLSALRNTREIAHVNFTRRRTEVKFPSADWFSYLRTQLTLFVGEVCLQSKKMFSALFSRYNFLPKGDT